MAKGNNQKLKALYLLKMLWENTDEEHGITMKEIISALENYGVSAERKSIYDDMERLGEFGIDVIKVKRGKDYYYYIGSRDFELPELKIMVDAVQASKFITEKKSNELIKKLESMVSRYEATQLQRQVIVAGRNKNANEQIYYSVDRLHTAISGNSRITFHYFQWDLKKKKVLRRDGKLYEVSPWALTWDDEKYYLIAYDSEAKKIKHYRVDKMLDIEIKEDPREGREDFAGLDMAAYANSTFGMFGGDKVSVKLLCKNTMTDVMIDRFGKDITMIKADEDHFTVNVHVAMSRHFLGWIFALGDAVKILSPDSVVEEMRREAERIVTEYGGLGEKQSG